MKRALTAAIMLLLTSCVVVVEEWIPSSPVDVAVYVDSGSTLTTPNGRQTKITTDAVLFPSTAFMQVIETFEKAVRVIDALEGRGDQDTPAEETIHMGGGAI